MPKRREVKAGEGASRAAMLCVVLLVGVLGGTEALAAGYGTVQTVGSGTDEITLVKVGGTRYQMGYWYGRLVADEIAACLASLSAAFPIPEAQYDAAIAAMWDPNYFDTAAYDQELQGMADGCADSGHPEVTFRELQKMQLLPDMSELGCSLFAAWGNATADGHLYQLRNLDWEMGAGVQNYPVVVIYDPDDGYVHAMIGFAGSIGMSGGGISENGIAQSQIMGYFCDPETLNGVPFPLLFREMAYHDTTLSEALTRIQNATRTNNYYYGISGPDGAEITGRLLLTSNTRCDIYADNQSVNPHPCVSPTPFHTSFDDVVYWRRHDGGGNDTFYNAINARYGNIDSTRSIEIAQIVGVSGTLLSIIYDATDGECWVAYANGLDRATNQGYVHIELDTPNDATALDAYVAAPDPNYTWTRVNTINGSGYKGYILDMKSQVWRDEPNEVDRELWQHWVKVIKPTTVGSTKALMFIGGGSNGGSIPTSVDSDLATVATTTNTVVVEVKMIPNQRIKFADETDPRYIASGRTEDELIAYTWDKFLRTGDELWPARLPMTKAVVRAMDATTEFCATPTGGSITVDEYVVAGGSKRGWTTWTTAAVDPRVIAIAPIVIDVLNVEESMTHHIAAYGYWAPAINDYVDMDIMGWFGTSELAALMALVDPYSYRARYTMPKFVINSSGDDFFLPDSSQFYYDDLPGEKHLRYVPNTDHSLDGSDAWQSLLAFYAAILTGTSRPEFSWTLEADGSIHVQTISGTPTAVKLWQATNTVARDFRKYPYLPDGSPTGYAGPTWTWSTLSDQGGGLYIGQVTEPPAGWTAFFVELTYTSGVPSVPFKFTTEVRVVPEAATLTLKVKKQGYGEVLEVDPNWPRHFRPDDTVTLTGVPNGNKTFKHWQIFHPNHPDDANYAVTDANNPVTILMEGDRKVVAKFKCGGGMGGALPALAIGLAICGLVSRRRRRRR